MSYFLTRIVTSAVWIKATLSDTTNGPKSENSCLLLNSRYVLMFGGCFQDQNPHRPCMSYSYDPLLYDVTIPGWQNYIYHTNGYFVPQNVSDFIGGEYNTLLLPQFVKSTWLTRFLVLLAVHHIAVRYLAPLPISIYKTYFILHIIGGTTASCITTHWFYLCYPFFSAYPFYSHSFTLLSIWVWVPRSESGKTTIGSPGPCSILSFFS